MSVSTCPSESPSALDATDRAIVLATQAGLPLVPDPWGAVGRPLGLSGEEVRRRLARMQEMGIVRRVAAVPNHYRLGYVANGMTVWDVDDAQVDRLGREVATIEGVSHCYRRPRHLPHWPYNLFAMLHGRSRDEVERQAEELRALLGGACRDHRILYSSRILKKTGLRLAGRPGAERQPEPRR
ncbi:MAG: AsnC family transcriptional regulator [Halomonas sp.]|nr:AsnC family transcriptional regulator [Halomonas sp.]